jgi:hypothetical protein
VIADEVGLQPSVTGEYVPVNVGGVRSLVHETDLDVVEELLQASTAVNVLTCVTIQPAVVGVASDEEILVTLPQASVAVAVPSATLIADEVGLHPRVELIYVPVNTGAVTSSTQITVLPTVEVFPQASIAVNVLICERLQPVVITAPSLCDKVGVPHPSEAVAEPSAAVIADEVGLHPKFCVV